MDQKSTKQIILSTKYVILSKSIYFFGAKKRPLYKSTHLYFVICFDAFALNTNMQKGCVNRLIASLPLVYNNKVPFPLYEEDEEDVADFRRRRPYRR